MKRARRHCRKRGPSKSFLCPVLVGSRAEDYPAVRLGADSRVTCALATHRRGRSALKSCQVTYPVSLMGEIWANTTETNRGCFAGLPRRFMERWLSGRKLPVADRVTRASAGSNPALSSMQRAQHREVGGAGGWSRGTTTALLTLGAVRFSPNGHEGNRHRCRRQVRPTCRQ